MNVERQSKHEKTLHGETPQDYVLYSLCSVSLIFPSLRFIFYLISVTQERVSAVRLIEIVAD